MSKNFIKIGFLLVICITLFYASSYAQAVDIMTDPIGAINPGTGITDIGGLVKKVIDVIITLSQVAFIILFLVGGAMYMTSAGNEEQAGKARKLIIEAIIGLIIVMSAWAVSNWVIGILK